MTLTFFLGRSCLGSCPAKPLIDTPHGPIFETSSRAYFCPHCGEVWARVLCSKPNSIWCVENRPCPACATHNTSPWMAQAGSLLDPEWWQGSALQITNPALPDDVVRHEFSVVLTKLSKELTYGNQAS